MRISRRRGVAFALAAALVLSGAVAVHVSRTVGRAVRLPDVADEPLPPGAVARIGAVPWTLVVLDADARFPDGSAFVRREGRGVVSVWDGTTMLRRGRYRVFDAAVPPGATESLIDRIGRVLRPNLLRIPPRPAAAAVGPGGRLVAVAGGSALRVLSLGDGRITASWVSDATPIGSVAFEADADVLTFAADGSVWRWDLTSGRAPVAQGTATPALVAALATPPDETRPDPRAGDRSKAMYGPRTDEAREAVASIDVAPATLAVRPGRLEAAVARADGRVDLVDLATGRTVHAISPCGDDVLSMGWSPDGTRLAVGRGASAGCWETWAADCGPGPLDVTRDGHHLRAALVDESPDTKPADRIVRFGCDCVPPGLASVPLGPHGSGERRAYGYAVSGDRTRLVGVEPAGRIVVWDVRTATAIFTLTVLSGARPRTMAADGRGDTIAWTTHEGVLVWRPAETALPRAVYAAQKLCPGMGPGPTLALSADGRRLAVARDGTILVVETGRLGAIARFDSPSDRTEDVEFTDDGRLLVSSARGEPAIVWDVDAAVAATTAATASGSSR